jgi:3-deoxy-D-manno-octulosonate 8-phosphate phosphatase KdsC-like HAD superfamily phosphatase
MKVFSDIDGVITPSRKIWGMKFETAISPVVRGQAVTMSRNDRGSLCVFKMYSDHDSAAINLYREHIVFISHDMKMNQAWCEHKQVPFIHVPDGNEKFTQICFHLTESWTPKQCPEYIYIGDTLNDAKSLRHATIGYVPEDAAESLLRKVRPWQHVRTVMREGGHGVLDWVFCDLVSRGVIKEPE